MMMEWVEKAVQPLLEREYQKGYEAGVAAEKLVKADDTERREYDLFRRGVEEGKRIAFDEIVSAEVEELSPSEFNELVTMAEETPFGFVGTIDDISLVLGEE